jgi:hypothetical protein
MAILRFLTPLAFIASLNAGIITFTGSDTGAGSADPRPNSNAAAASFDTAAAALGTENLITFESAPLGAFTNLTVATGVTINGTDYVGNPQTISATDQGPLFAYNTTAGGSKYLYVYAGNVIFTFGPGVQAFGAYLTGVQLDGETILFDDGTSETITIPDPGNGVGGVEFVGFTDAGKSIASIEFYTPNPSNSLGDFIGVDDVRFVTNGAVTAPEPSTMLLMSAALSGLGLLRLRRKS